MNKVKRYFSKVWVWVLLIATMFYWPSFIGQNTQNYLVSNYIDEWKDTTSLAILAITTSQISALIASGVLTRMLLAGRRHIDVTLVAIGYIFQRTVLYMLACAGLVWLVLLFHLDVAGPIFFQLFIQQLYILPDLFFFSFYFIFLILPILFFVGGRFGFLVLAMTVAFNVGVRRLLMYALPNFFTDLTTRYFPDTIYAQFGHHADDIWHLLVVLGYVILFFLASWWASGALLKTKKAA